MKDITDKEFDMIRDFIRNRYGISLNDTKKSLIVSRLRNTIDRKGFDNFSDYFHYLLTDNSDEALVPFVDNITTNHTFFMREPDHFNYFKETALPFIVQNSREKDMRIWSAGCSTGEEPYTLQMLIQEYLQSDRFGWDTQMLATDISTRALETASKGIYTVDQLKPLPADWKLKYMKKVDANNMAFKDIIKNEIIFRKQNLMDPFPFRKKFHIIFCRNVMIYFDNETKSNLIDKFYNYLVDGGYLFIGHSESLSFTDTKFKYIKPALYRRV